MKRTFFTLLFLSVAILGLNAQAFFVVHGTVNNLNGQPVNGHQVFIASDSLNSPPSWNFFDVVYTNPNGYFMDTVPFIGGTNMAFRVYTFDCNQMIHDTLVYSGSQQGMIEFNICDQATPGCQAAFQAYTDSAGTHFTDYSVGNISNWLWDFNDPAAGVNNTSTLQNPTHIYTFPGVYMVCLIVSSGDSLGCTSTWCDYINVGNAPGCQAAFQAYPDSAGTLTYQFIDYSVGNNFNWAWNFGDPVSGTMNFTTVQNPSHTFSSPGVYTVCLTITSSDSTWCTSTWCDNITIGNVPGCQAAFQASANPGTQVYQFIDYSVGNISGWYWNFGDNTASYLQNPQHTYAGPGVYNVCLNIWSNDTLGCNSTWCDTIVVGNAPPCSNYFSYTTSLMTASFAGTSIGYANPTYSWSFGDGSSGTGQYLTHTYASIGYYPVVLTTSDSSGCTYSSTQMVYIEQQGDFIWGQVTTGNTFADHARVLLYATAGGTNIFTLIDSTIVDSSGYYQFAGINYNVIFLKAELLPESAYYGDYMPTYFDSAMYWNEATGIVVWQPYNQYNIGLLPTAGIASTGNGEMNGSVTYGSGKGMAAAGVEVILLDASGNPLAYTYTDNAGWFSFADLGYDTYAIYIEMPGMTTSAASATLDETNPTATMAFVIGENSIALSVEENLPAGFKGIGQVFPNPVKSEAAVMINLERNSNFELKVINFIGSILNTEELTKPTGQHKVVLNTTQLPSGVYGLLITSPDGSRTIRKFLVVR